MVSSDRVCEKTDIKSVAKLLVSEVTVLRFLKCRLVAFSHEKHNLIHVSFVLNRYPYPLLNNFLASLESSGLALTRYRLSVSLGKFSDHDTVCHEEGE